MIYEKWTDSQLLQEERRLRGIFEAWLAGSKKGSIEAVVNAHELVKDEILRRKLPYKRSAIDEYLDIIRKQEINEIIEFEEAKHGLILVKPHGEMIMTGEKTLIIKRRHFGKYIGEPLYLIEGNQALGIIVLKSPKPISIKEFFDLQPRHRISESELHEWWPGAYSFYAYEFDIIEKFKEPKPIERPVGPQVFITDVKFLENYLAEIDFLKPVDTITEREIKEASTKILWGDLYYLEIGWNRLKDGKWGNWTKDDIIKTTAFIMKELRERGYEVPALTELKRKAEKYLQKELYEDINIFTEDLIEMDVPIGHPEGKLYLAKRIVPLLPEHKIYCEPFCLVKDSEVLSESGWKPIQEMRVGERVFSSLEFKTICQTYEREYQGQILKIKVKGYFDSVSFTENHPILCIKRELLSLVKQEWRKSFPYPVPKIKFSPIKSSQTEKQVKLKKLTVQRARELLKYAEYIKASEIKKGDLLVYHFDNLRTNCFKHPRISLPIARHGGRRRNRRISVCLSRSFCRLIGLYLAEGCYSNSSVLFTFNKKEVDLIDFVRKEMKRIFDCNGFNMKKSINSNVVALRFSSVQASRFFQQFGRRARNKFIPENLKRLSNSRLLMLLRGLFEGDGHFAKKDKSFSITTTSKKLADDIFLLLLRLGFCPTLTFGKQTTALPFTKRKIDCVYFTLRVGSDGAKRFAKLMGKDFIFGSPSHLSRRNGINLLRYYQNKEKIGFLLRRVESIIYSNYNGKVYNLQVVDSHSFITRIATVHNCGSGAVFFSKPKSEVEILNDIDENITFFLKFLQRCNEEDINWLKRKDWTPSKKKYEKFLNSDWKSLEDKERIYRYFYAKRYSFNRNLKEGISEYYNKVGKGDRPLIPVLFQSKWKKFHDRLQRVKIYNKDYEEILFKYDSQDTLFYIDPPYPSARTSRIFPFTQEDLEKLKENLEKLKGKFILSISSDYQNFFEDFEVKQIYTRHIYPDDPKLRGKRRELLVSNFKLKEIEMETAPIYPGYTTPRQEPILLDEMLSYFDNDGFEVIHPVAYLCGNICNWGFSDGDIDLVINLPENLPEEIKIPIIFRIFRMIPLSERAKIWPRLHITWKNYVTSFTNHIPLWSLKFQSIKPFELIEMEEPKWMLRYPKESLRQAEEAKEKDKVVLFEFFYPLKSGQPAFPLSRENNRWDTKFIINYFLEKELLKESR